MVRGQLVWTKANTVAPSLIKVAEQLKGIHSSPQISKTPWFHISPLLADKLS